MSAPWKIAKVRRKAAFVSAAAVLSATNAAAGTLTWAVADRPDPTRAAAGPSAENAAAAYSARKSRKMALI